MDTCHECGKLTQTVQTFTKGVRICRPCESDIYPELAHIRQETRKDLLRA